MRLPWAVLNYATEIAKDIVSNGDIVDFGDLGTLKPSFNRAIAFRFIGDP